MGACYNTENSASEKGGQWQHAVGMLVSMRHQNLLLDVISYNSTISACVKGGQWQHALGLLVGM